MNEDLQGISEGIGVEYFILSDTVYASNVLANGPSDKAGIKTGDLFLVRETPLLPEKTSMATRSGSSFAVPPAPK